MGDPDVQFLCENLSTAHYEVASAAAAVRKWLNSVETGNVEPVADAEQTETLVGRLERALEDCRNALAMIDAIEVSAAQVQHYGVNGAPLAALQAWQRGNKAGVFESEETLMEGARRALQTETLEPFVKDGSVEELAAVVERVAVTRYRVPDGMNYPCWLNVQCGLSVVDAWLHKVGGSGSDRHSLLPKMRQVKRLVFNSKALRQPVADAHEASLKERDNLKRLLVSGAVTEGLPSNLDFTTALELAQTTCRELLSRQCWRYRVALIEGDGNCFFRAIVRGLTPNVPRDFEDALSLELRKLVNSSESSISSSQEIKELKEFEITDESDPDTMLEAGVWADHVQIAKVASFLGRKIWLIRCDDPELQMDAEGHIEPSEHYQIGPDNNTSSSSSSPILLYYQTSPGHFETLLSSEMRTLAEELSAMPRSLLGLCNCFFRLEKEQTELEEMLARRSDVSLPLELRQTMADEGKEQSRTLQLHLNAFQSKAKSLDGDALRDDPLFHLFGDLAERILADASSALMDDSFGPMQQLRHRMIQCRVGIPLSNALPSSGLRPGFLLNNNNNAAVNNDEWDDDDPPPALYSPSQYRHRDATPERTPKASPMARGNDVTQLMADATATVDRWQQCVRSHKLETGRSWFAVVGITVEASSVTACWEALRLLYKNDEYRQSVHINLSKCTLPDETCKVIAGRAPVNVSVISLLECEYDASKWGLRFSVKQHIQDKSR